MLVARGFAPTTTPPIACVPRHRDKTRCCRDCSLSKTHVNYAGFFGWPNLTNTPTGGFLGLPASDTAADMRVVDIYRRDGDKLAENWVLIDLPWWLKQQGLDVLERTRSIVGS